MQFFGRVRRRDTSTTADQIGRFVLMRSAKRSSKTINDVQTDVDAFVVDNSICFGGKLDNVARQREV